MSAIITVRIQCDRCSNFKVMETASVTTARRMLAKLGWKVILMERLGESGRSYGDLCPECPVAHNRMAWRYAAHEQTPQRKTAVEVIGNALPRRAVKVRPT